MKPPTKSASQSIAILGAGSFGTAIAIHLAAYGHTVLLWGRDHAQIARMSLLRQNEKYLPGLVFPDKLEPTTSLSACFSAGHVIVATPSHAFSSLLSQLPDTLSGLSWLTKGIDAQTSSFLSDLVFQRYGHDFPVAMISGPSFSKEIARHLPTALVVASNQRFYAETLRHIFHKTTIRTYLTEDLKGVQLCGAMKNILAIACGISDGLGYGANAKAALITRGLDEMMRFGQKFSAEPETFFGLAGLGDLVLTCTDDQSRNRRFGLLIGQGDTLEEAESKIGQVVEGKHNAAQIYGLAQHYKMELPICGDVYRVLTGICSVEEAAQHLMDRPLR